MEPEKRELISIAPMLDVTNQYFRYFMRLITSQAVLYTQMIHHNTILMNPKGYKEMLKYDDVNHPLVVQLGGSEPTMLADCCKFAEEMGYDQINLNVGCPSHKVQTNKFGACLMKQPSLVAQLAEAMTKSVSIPCTIKCRLGVDNLDSYEFCRDFIEQVSKVGNIRHFVIHARKAHLKGLNPSQNRNIPPLKYDYVYQLQKDFPHLLFTLNGGIRTISQAKQLIQQNNLYGCMIGRGAYEDPWEMRKIDNVMYGKVGKNYSRQEVLELYGDFVEKRWQEDPLASIPMLVKPIINILNGVNHSSKYRQMLSQTKELEKMGGFSEIIQEAIKAMKEFCPGEAQKRKYE